MKNNAECFNRNPIFLLVKLEEFINEMFKGHSFSKGTRANLFGMSGKHLVLILEIYEVNVWCAHTFVVKEFAVITYWNN